MNIDQLPKELRGEVRELQARFYALVASLSDRADAIVVKEAVCRPLGILNSKFDLVPNNKKRSKFLLTNKA